MALILCDIVVIWSNGGVDRTNARSTAKGFIKGGKVNGWPLNLLIRYKRIGDEESGSWIKIKKHSDEALNL